MAMPQALRSRLLNDSGVRSVAGTRIDWGMRSQGAALTAITLQMVVDERVQNMTEFDGLQPGYVQIDVWASSYLNMMTGKESVIAAVVPAGVFYGTRFTRGFVTARDLNEDGGTATIFRASIDLQFFHTPA